MSDSKGHGKKRWGTQNPSQASPAAGLSILKLDGSNCALEGGIAQPSLDQIW
jgi:hypothetical protein